MAVLGYVAAALVGAFIDEAARQGITTAFLDLRVWVFIAGNAFFLALIILPVWLAIVLLGKKCGKEGLFYYSLCGLTVGLTLAPLLTSLIDDAVSNSITSLPYLNRLVAYVWANGPLVALRGAIAGATYWSVARV